MDDSELSSLDPPTRDASSSESGSEALTEISASEASVSDDEEQVTSRRGKPSKASPRNKGKGKGKGKGATVGAKGRGRRLGDGEEVEDSVDMSDDESDEMELEGMDEETRIMTLQDMKEKKRAQKRQNEEKMKPIKEEERKLSKKLGRKLTNGERNLIRLVKVSLARLACVSYRISAFSAPWRVRVVTLGVGCRWLTCRFSITPSSTTSGAISKPKSPPSSPLRWTRTRRSSSSFCRSKRRVCTG
jgi:hypothetical protein